MVTNNFVRALRAILYSTSSNATYKQGVHFMQPRILIVNHERIDWCAIIVREARSPAPRDTDNRASVNRVITEAASFYGCAKLWTGPGMAAAPSVLALMCLLLFNSFTCISWMDSLSISLKHDFHTYPWSFCTSRCDLLVGTFLAHGEAFSLRSPIQWFVIMQ